MVPELGFGIMRFQDINGEVNYEEVKAAIDEYMKGEVCYFDIHPGYVNGLAQEIVRKYVVERYDRASYLLANKMPYYGIYKEQDYRIVFETELKACGVTFFDRYMLHSITREVYLMHQRLGGFEFLKRIKSEGSVCEIGISFHDMPDLLEEILENYPSLDFVQLQINYYDWLNPIIKAKEIYEVAKKYNKKIVVMEPIKGGSLAYNPRGGSKALASDRARLCLEFVARLDNIDIILSGMTNSKQVQENRCTLRETEQVASLDEYLDLKNEYEAKCTNCGYCKRECPQKIKIPEIIQLLNASMNVGENDTTVLEYHSIFIMGILIKNQWLENVLNVRNVKNAVHKNWRSIDI